MKQTFLPLSTFLFLFIYAFQIQAQITITKDDFPRQAAFIDTGYIVAAPSQVNIPTFGAEQIWDYAHLTSNEFLINEYFDATMDDNFPNAFNLRQRDLVFQAFPISSVSYIGLDEGGWFDVGRTITDVTYPITAITGGANDQLRFVGENSLFDGRINTLDFPVSYESQWEQSRIDYINFELTVAAFGLASTPGFRQRLQTENREVVAYGELTIPDVNGDPTPAINALLLKVERIMEDSVFLGGAPAPAALLTAFGLAQGVIATEVFYVFYTADFGSPIMNINLDENNEVSSSVYRPQVADAVTAVRHLRSYTVNYFPNPISKGQILTIQTEFQTFAGIINMYNLRGQLIKKMPYSSMSGHEIQLKMPNNVNGGLYSYELYDQTGLAVGKGKLIVN